MILIVDNDRIYLKQKRRRLCFNFSINNCSKQIEIHLFKWKIRSYVNRKELIKKVNSESVIKKFSVSNLKKGNIA